MADVLFLYKGAFLFLFFSSVLIYIWSFVMYISSRWILISCGYKLPPRTRTFFSLNVIYPEMLEVDLSWSIELIYKCDSGLVEWIWGFLFMPFTMCKTMARVVRVGTNWNLDVFSSATAFPYSPPSFQSTSFSIFNALSLFFFNVAHTLAGVWPSILSFHLYMNSGDQTQVVRFLGQAPLPAKPTSPVILILISIWVVFSYSLLWIILMLIFGITWVHILVSIHLGEELMNDRLYRD